VCAVYGARSMPRAVYVRPVRCLRDVRRGVSCGVQHMGPGLGCVLHLHAFDMHFVKFLGSA
jgi:hypothetical protein